MSKSEQRRWQWHLKKKKKIHTGAEAAKGELIKTGTCLQVKWSATFQIQWQWRKANETMRAGTHRLYGVAL